MIFAPVDAPEWANVLPESLKEFLAAQKGLPAEKTVLIPEKMWINAGRKNGFDPRKNVDQCL